MNFLSTILDIIFPVKCLFCGERGIELCARCLIDSPSAERKNDKWIFPLYDYRHPPIKKAILALKYKNKKRIANIFGETMYSRILEELGDLSIMENFHEPILIPIPLSRERIMERGYNQAELICREIVKIQNSSKNLAPPLAPLSLSRRGAGGEASISNEAFTLLTNVLIKPKDTEHQAHIEDRATRLKNIIGSFAIKNPEKIKGRNIILIDDVITTGATLTEAKKTLKRAGARKVIAFTVAH